MNSEDFERRKENRLPVKLNAFLQYKIVDLENLSLNGMKIVANEKISESDNISIFLFLPDNKILKLNGDVVWSKRIGETEFCNGIYIHNNSKRQYLDFISLF